MNEEAVDHPINASDHESLLKYSLLPDEYSTMVTEAEWVAHNFDLTAETGLQDPVYNCMNEETENNSSFD